MLFSNVANDRQTETRAASLPIASTVHSIKPLEDPGHISPRYPFTSIGHCNHYCPGLAVNHYGDGATVL